MTVNQATWYPIYIVSLVIVGYGLLLKTILIVTIVYLSCAEFRDFWVDSWALPAFSIVQILLVVFAASPIIQKVSGASVSRLDILWSVIATTFSLYVLAWLVLLFAFVHRDVALGSKLDALLGLGGEYFSCLGAGA